MWPYAQGLKSCQIFGLPVHEIYHQKDVSYGSFTRRAFDAWRKIEKFLSLSSESSFTCARNAFPWDPFELRLRLLPVLEWTCGGSGLIIGWSVSVGLAEMFVADAVAGSVAVDVFDVLNVDMKPERLIDRLSESSMASTWIISSKHGERIWKRRCVLIIRKLFEGDENVLDYS